MATKREIMIIAGEISGDMHGASLVRALQACDPDLRCFGIGGEAMRAAGVETFHDVTEMAVIGFWEALLRYRYLRGIFEEMLALAARRKPDAVVLIDYPGFNLRFAQRAHAMGLKVVYYICPQVWAWNRARIPRMAVNIDHLVTIFPFEAQHFADTGLKVSFAGHPLVDEIAHSAAQPVPELPWQGAPRIAILPGSRRREIELILPPLWHAAALIEKERPDASFILPAPSPALEQILRDRLRSLSGGPTHWAITTGQTHHVLKQARATLIASGTATLEASLLRCPMVITYKVAPLSAFLMRRLLTVKYAGLVNIIADREICPERLQQDCTPAALAHALLPLLDDAPPRSVMLAALDEVNSALGPPGAASRAAAAVLSETGALRIRRP